MHYFFAVVFGPEWEDVEYYIDFQEAKEALVCHTKKLDDSFSPLLRCLELKDKRYVDANPPYTFDEKTNEMYQMDV